MRGEITLPEQRRSRVRDAFDRSGMTDAAADRIVSEFIAGYEASWRLFPDVLRVLDELKSIPLGIVTNGNADQQRTKLRRTGILDRFAIVVVSEDIGYSKPSPQIFHHACGQLGREPTECIFVGDDWEKDVEGALSGGLRPIWMDRFGARVERITTSLPSIGSLLEIVERDDRRALTGLDHLLRSDL